MKKSILVWMFYILCGSLSLSAFAAEHDYVRGTDRYEMLSSEAQADFEDNLDLVVSLTNDMLAESEIQMEITASDVDFSLMYHIYTPTTEQFLAALQSGVTAPDSTWQSMWVLPVFIGDAVYTFRFDICHGVSESHLHGGENGTPLLDEEELAALAAREGHYVYYGGAFGTRESFMKDVLSYTQLSGAFADILDAAELEKASLYYVPGLDNGVCAWIVTDQGEQYFLPTEGHKAKNFADSIVDSDVYESRITANEDKLNSAEPVPYTQKPILYSEFTEAYQELKIAEEQQAGCDTNADGEYLYGGGSYFRNMNTHSDRSRCRSSGSFCIRSGSGFVCSIPFCSIGHRRICVPSVPKSKE